jgi:DNA-binding IclR family transcriptional regulator
LKRKQGSISYAPSTVRKALSIVSILADEKDGLGMVSLAKKLNLNRSTVYRLVSALMEGGFVKQDPATQKYRLGLKIVELAGSMLADIEVREVARPFLEELMRLSGETVHLGVLGERGEIVYIDKIEGTEAVRLLTRVGKTLPAHVTAMGKAIMAYLPEPELEEVLKHQRYEVRTENAITNETALREHLKLVRTRGYATDLEENRLTVCCVGAPVFDATGKAIAAISVTGPSFRLTAQRMETLSGAVTSTAMEISRNLGCQLEITVPTMSRENEERIRRRSRKG